MKIKIARTYKSNKKPDRFFVQDENDYIFGRYDTLENAISAMKEYKKKFKNINFYILEML